MYVQTTFEGLQHRNFWRATLVEEIVRGDSSSRPYKGLSRLAAGQSGEGGKEVTEGAKLRVAASQ